MPKSFSHQDSRERICVACGIRTAKKKSVNNSEELLVRKYCKPNFDTTLREQPTGLCSNCRWYLFACKRGDNWEDIGRPDPRIRWDQYELEHGRFNEREHSEDNCSICELAKWNPVGEPDLNANKRYLMRSKATVPPEKKKFKFCPNCYQHTGPGIPHPPCTPAAAKKNLAELVSQLDTTGQQQVVSSSLKLLASSSNTEPGSEMRLTQLRGGNRLSVTLGKSKATKTTSLTSGFMASLQKKLNCSGRKIMMTLREFKKEGIKFEAGIREELEMLSHSLDAFYKVEKLEFVGKNENKENVPMDLDLVYLEDTEAFITHVIGERGLDAERVIVRVGLDGGGGSFKVTASIFETTFQEVEETTFQEVEESEGDKLTGANKLLVFGMSEGLEENYYNVRIVVEKLRLNEIECCFASDLKLINCLLGISSHSGKYACPYCEAPMSLELGALRTYGRLEEWYTKLQEDAARSRNPETFVKRNQKHYMNVVHPSLLKGDPETTILSDVPLPELHLLMGVVNWAVELLYKLVPKEELLQRMRSKSISVHGYHGGGLDGGNSSQFLKNLDFLFEPLPDNLQPIHTMLTKFRQVVSSCFSMELAITFREDIDAFNESVHGLVDYSNQTLQIKLQPTWKIHILVTHLKPFLEEKMTGLGVFCEQTSEASHAVMKPTLQRFKRRSDHRLHGPKLLRACTDFSSKNM